MKNTKVMAAVLGILGGACLTEAHVVAGSLNIKGGETLTAGATKNITWTQQFGHNDGKYRIRYSKNGGTDWTDVEASWQGPKGDGAAMSYSWTVPSDATAQGKIHVNFIRGGLTDPDYNLTSGNFTVSASSGVRQAATEAGNSVSFNPANRNVEVSFAAARDARVTLQVFDAKGKSLATLLDGPRKAGAHRLSIFSSSLAAGGPLLFQLRVGDQLHTFRN